MWRKVHLVSDAAIWTRDLLNTNLHPQPLDMVSRYYLSKMFF